eukprot:CAMPEP_0204585488 /NCGR_PEP_ID=MMETSP0661-20131031/46952_1 /ASSEMBLY_ACC=CAM_ASM_000606 /TAXON_ID=109239 /ORGANISM="Alexandrium margalefi, Strain AMGDE01CS-322" /LENGTH=151 /DNA_ID=CAMNT_0051595045 /DNA_START=22 /DNA_END=474 /DNA_ORIENTATION=+
MGRRKAPRRQAPPKPEDHYAWHGTSREPQMVPGPARGHQRRPWLWLRPTGCPAGGGAPRSRRGLAALTPRSALGPLLDWRPGVWCRLADAWPADGSSSRLFLRANPGFSSGALLDGRPPPRLGLPGSRPDPPELGAAGGREPEPPPPPPLP